MRHAANDDPVPDLDDPDTLTSCPLRLCVTLPLWVGVALGLLASLGLGVVGGWLLAMLWH